MQKGTIAMDHPSVQDAEERMKKMRQKHNASYYERRKPYNELYKLQDEPIKAVKSLLEILENEAYRGRKENVLSVVLRLRSTFEETAFSQNAVFGVRVHPKWGNYFAKPPAGVSLMEQFRLIEGLKTGNLTPAEKALAESFQIL